MSGTVIVETLRRHFAHLAYIVAVLMLMVVSASMAAFGAAPGFAFQMFSLFTIIAGCQLIGREFSSGTLQLILSKPISRSRYLLSRVAGVVLALWVPIALIIITDVAARLLAGKNVEWIVAAGGTAALAAEVVLICSLMAFFGSFTRSYLNVALYLGGELVLSMINGVLGLIQRLQSGSFASAGAFLRDHPGVVNTVRTIEENLYPDAPSIAFDRQWFLMVFCNAAVALLLACLIFRRREVPYGAD